MAAAAQPYTGQATLGERSYLGQGSTITGDLVFPGFIEISGKISGNVSADSIVLGESGIVEGSLTAASITVRGRMKGRLFGETIALQSSARFEGEVSYSQISIESGAEVMAKIRRAKG